ncbi:hypothetical protein FVE85_5126 [Porphyridium purpureum]|uniref:Uncharacterized protein n=1 Tax=Porphyridium purpureum TaxID=35688 RepID=A0A5J4Z0Y8_PORPP|nr:hypothetical protein FVE85_5126 [Porphyridium purpureum]|eukprot:POR1855..scf295_1
MNSTGAGVPVVISQTRGGGRFIALEHITGASPQLSPDISDFAEEFSREHDSLGSNSDESENAFNLASRSDETQDQDDDDSALVTNLDADYDYALCCHLPCGTKSVTLDDPSASEGASDEQSTAHVVHFERR